ncbi:NAD-dependent protein deacetylase [Euzebya sp.]|uniref:NAD-dependent protein deacetylase n=1 Tax=Euzebya sp. TaxID=1971409 RepID=UPI003517505D
MDVRGLVDLLVAHQPVAVLSGAGISTDSGIPDYRGSGVDRRRRPPITYRAFMREPRTRRRYWARSHVGYRHVAAAVPNPGHRAVAALQRAGLVGPVVTQNVDGLHQAGGAVDVLDIHGRLDRVICTACGDVTARGDFGARLTDANPAFAARAASIAPDGDADLRDDEVDGFRVPACEPCGGVLKPDVVFFGESMPRVRRERAAAAVADAGALLVLGSSLAVMSGYRLVLQAAADRQPIGIVTRGPSRGDHLAAVRVDDGLSAVLDAVVRTATAPAPAA